MAAPTRRIKTSKIFVTRRSSRVAAPRRLRHGGALFSQADRRSRRREIQHRDRLPRRRGNRSGDAKRRSAVPRRQPGRILRQRADAHMVQESASRACWCMAARSEIRGLPDVPTVNEIMDRRKAPDVTRRLAVVLMSPDSIGRPLIAPPGLAGRPIGNAAGSVDESAQRS